MAKAGQCGSLAQSLVLCEDCEQYDTGIVSVPVSMITWGKTDGGTSSKQVKFTYRYCTTGSGRYIHRFFLGRNLN